MTRRALIRTLVVAAVLAAIVLIARLETPHHAPGRVPRLAHVIVIVFENKERQTVIGSNAAPTFNRLASTYAQATDYQGVAHPSLPNYLALVSGSTHGVTTDCYTCPQPGPTIGSQLTAKHRRWAAYAEDPPASRLYDQAHVPFLYFRGGHDHVLPLSRFKPTKLPAYSLVIPNLCHDMHVCAVVTGDRWLHHFIAPLLAVKRTAIFVVFDEGTTDNGGGGTVPLLVAGTAVRRHSVYTSRTSHYGLLHTIESALGLKPLGLARSAPLLTGIWR
jgi:acid phosphatase